MKLTLHPDHPLARAIVASSGEIMRSDGRMTLSLDTYDGDLKHERPLCVDVVKWTISKGGRHANDDEQVFECEFTDPYLAPSGPQQFGYGLGLLIPAPGVPGDRR